MQFEMGRGLDKYIFYVCTARSLGLPALYMVIFLYKLFLKAMCNFSGMPNKLLSLKISEI